MRDTQVEEFERHRRYLRSVAYRMLGSMSEADDAVQEVWLRLNRADRDDVRNMRGWLTTVVARVCLDMLRERRARQEDYTGSWLPEPVVRIDTDGDPEEEALLADSIGIAMLVVLETLTPAERLAFVLHDMFGVSFDEIAEIVDRTPDASRQLASRARRRVQGRTPRTDPDLATQRRIVDAFLSASRDGDFEALLQVLDPEVVFRIDAGSARIPGGREARGAENVARRVLARGRPLAGLARTAIVNGAAGVVVVSGGKPISVVGFTVAHERIVAIDVVVDPTKLSRITA
jgi:RNA polymerase sigma-70 factor (ECF subfamily)